MVTLTDGRDIKNFDQAGNADWRIAERSIVANHGNGFLVTFDAPYNLAQLSLYDGDGNHTLTTRDVQIAWNGTTIFGGPTGGGAIFRLRPGGSGFIESVLYSFAGGSDGDKPWGVTQYSRVLYGVTFAGGGLLLAKNCAIILPRK